MLPKNPRRHFILFSAVTTLPLLAHATELSVTWTGPAVGSWNNSANWTPAVVPNDGADTYDVFVDGGNAQNTSTTIDFSPTILSLNISAGDSVTLGNTQTLNLVNTLNNAGTFTLGSTGGRTQVHISGNGTVTFTGGGTIVLVPNTIFENGGVYVNSNNTIQGAGNLGGNNAGFINSGTINANVSGFGLFLDSDGVFTNNGTMIASGGGSLGVSGNAGGGYTNNGTIIAQNNSEVQIRDNVTVTGGIYSTVGTGTISVIAHNSGTLTGFANTGAMIIENGGFLTVGGTVINTGSITFAGGTDLAQIQSTGASTFSGGGTINLFGNCIFANGGGTITNSNNTIQGSGNLGGNIESIVNNGTVIASTASASIFLDSNGNAGSIGFVNNGTMIAAVNSKLIPSGNAGGGYINNGTIIAATGGTVQFSESSFVLGAGTIIVQSGGAVTTGLNGGASITTGQAVINGTWTQDNHSNMLLGNFRGSGTLNITGASGVTVAPNGAASATSIIKSLTIDGSSGLDLKNNSLIIDYDGPDTTVVGKIRGYLASAYDGGAWDKPGLTSLTAGGTSGAGKTGLGYLDTAGTNITSFSGQPVDNSAILVKYTYVGDTNLDGKVDVTDLGALSSRWQQTGNWVGGDFNYDGTVNVTDLGLLATNWQQGVISPQLGPQSFQQALEEVGLGNVVLPEPAMLGFAGLGLASALIRRHRRKI